MVVPAGASEDSSFTHLKAVKSAIADNATLRQGLKKWGILDNLQFLAFRYDKSYHRMQAEQFVTDFFSDPAVQAAFQVKNKAREWQPITGRVTKVDCRVLPADATRLDVFDKLADADPPILRAGTWELMKCFDDERDGFIIQDMLREFILKGDESENCGLLTPAEQEQFLWQLLQKLVLGGAMNQFEDNADVYRTAAKALYKDLLAVRKDSTTGKIEVSSAVYEVLDVGNDGGWKLFPRDSRSNFCYIVTDPMTKICRCIYHAMVPYW